MAALCSIHVRMLYRTCRRTTLHADVPRRYLDRGRPVIACFWHGGLLLMWVFCIAARVGRLPGWPLRVLVSPRRQGRFFILGLRWMGIETIAGASGPGGATAARSIRKALAEGVSILIAPDGPRGPRRQASPSVARLAGLCGAPLVPVGCASSKRAIVSTWDRLVVPLPFARLVYVFGDPLDLPRHASAELVDSAHRLLEERITAATIEAERLSAGVDWHFSSFGRDRA